jgi:hypothetical protein
MKVVSVWSEFKDEDLSVRPRHDDSRGRSVHELMVLQMTALILPTTKCLAEQTF